MATRFATPGIPTLYAGDKLFSLPLRTDFMKTLADLINSNAGIDPKGALRGYTRYRAHLTEEMLERVQESR